MKTIKLHFIFLLLILISCKPDFERRDFLVVETGIITSSSIETVTLESELIGIANGKIAEHGYVYSSSNELPTLITENTERKLLGIKLEGGLFSGTIENLDLNTTYSIRAFALLDGELEAEYGTPVDFRPSDYSLEVTTDSFNFAIGGFELFGTVKELEPGVILERYGFVWSHDNELPEVENDTPIYLGSIDRDTSFSKRELDVAVGENYHVRAFAQIGNDVFYGETISFFKGDFWTQKQDVPDARDGAYFSVVNGRMYVGGGYRAGSRYELLSYDPLGEDDPEIESWEEETTFGYLCNHGAAFTIEDTLYVVTGNDGIGDTLWAYNTIEKTWFPRANFPGVGQSFTVAHAVDGKGYIGMGRTGNGGSGTLLSDVWRYDPVTNSWMEMPPFPGGPRREPVIYADDQNLYIGFGKTKNDLYAFDVISMIWEEKEGIPLDPFTAEHFSGFRIGDKAYLLMSTIEDNFWEYDIPSDTWKQKSNFTGTVMNNPVFFDLNGKGYVGMGFDGFTGTDFNWTMWEYVVDSE